MPRIEVEEGQRAINLELHCRDIKKQKLVWGQIRVTDLDVYQIDAALERFGSILQNPQARLSMATAILEGIKAKQS
jgi:hypothetical protein